MKKLSIPHINEDLLMELLKVNPTFGEPGSDRFHVPPDLVKDLTPEERSDLVAALGTHLAARAGLRRREDDSGPVQSTPLTQLRFAAAGFERLYAHVSDRLPFVLNSRYSCDTIVDFGAESLVLAGLDRSTGAAVAAKLPFVNYPDLSMLDTARLMRQRARLEREARTLACTTGLGFPAFVDVFEATNPLFPRALPAFVRDREIFVIMERLVGTRIDHAARQLQRMGSHQCLARLVAAITAAYLRMETALASHLGRGSIYTDIKPENAMVLDQGIRVVDASSVRTRGDQGSPALVSELYLSEEDWRAWRAGKLAPGAKYVIRCVVRCARGLATREPLLVGEPAPTWPRNLEASLGSIDSLASERTLEGAAKRATALALDVPCPHGSGGEQLMGCLAGCT